MTALIAKELRLLLRDRSLLPLAAAMLLSMLAALASGQARWADHTRERVAAAAIDERVWLGQGARNPHSAAHFSRYAFKPVPSLAVLDPGSLDYAGLAIWLEAHYQDPAVLRRAEDGSELQRLGTLTPARILQLGLPLLAAVVLFGAVAAEREDGTLRQLAASGVSAGAVFTGKLAGAALSLSAATAPAPALLLVVLVGLTTSSGVSHPDRSLRIVWLVAVYGAYLLGSVAFALSVSALARTRRDAFVALVGSWSVLVVIAPTWIAETAVSVQAHVDSQTVNQGLRNASMSLWEDRDLQEDIREETLARHGVDDVDDLPFNWDAFFLQQSEEAANPLFDQLYDEVGSVHARQERVLALGAFLSPVIAVQRLSAALAGTDRAHHEAFVDAAESHRRDIVRRLNEDMMHNAGGSGYGYLAGRALWESIPALDHTPPRMRELAPTYALEAGALAAWCMAFVALARWSVGRAMRSEP